MFIFLIYKFWGHLCYRRGQMTFRGCYWDQAFVESYIERRVSEWVNAVECLSSIAHTQPHAAYAAFTHGLMSKWTYITRAISNIGDLLSPLEDVIRRKFLTSLRPDKLDLLFLISARFYFKHPASTFIIAFCLGHAPY